MTVLLLTSATLGTVNQVANETSEKGLEFGKTMMAKFLHNLENKAKDIDTIICYTEGVSLFHGRFRRKNFALLHVLRALPFRS